MYRARSPREHDRQSRIILCIVLACHRHAAISSPQHFLSIPLFEAATSENVTRPFHFDPSRGCTRAQECIILLSQFSTNPPHPARPTPVFLVRLTRPSPWWPPVIPRSSPDIPFAPQGKHEAATREKKRGKDGWKSLTRLWCMHLLVPWITDWYVTA